MRNYLYIPVESCPVCTRRYVIARTDNTHKLTFCGSDDDETNAELAARQIPGSVIVDTARRSVV